MQHGDGVTRRTQYVLAATALSVAAALVLPRIPQPADYHDFADHRAVACVANFFDVASNLGFLVVGLAGLVVIGIHGLVTGYITI